MMAVMMVLLRVVSMAAMMAVWRADLTAVTTVAVTAEMSVEMMAYTKVQVCARLCTADLKPPTAPTRLLTGRSYRSTANLLENQCCLIETS